VSVSVDTVGLALHGADLAASPAPADPIPVPPAGGAAPRWELSRVRYWVAQRAASCQGSAPELAV
jgi:hypothetical protein